MVGQFPRQERPLNKTAATTTTTPESFQTIGSAGNKIWKIFATLCIFLLSETMRQKVFNFFPPKSRSWKFLMVVKLFNMKMAKGSQSHCSDCFWGLEQFLMFMVNIRVDLNWSTEPRSKFKLGSLRLVFSCTKLVQTSPRSPRSFLL